MKTQYFPKLRETDDNTLVGMRGYLYYFQDMATGHMHSFGKGNDTVPDDYGICWMYTKYKMHLEREADFNTVDLETWIEKTRFPGVIHQALEISRGGEIFARGRLESCLVDIESKRLAKPSAIEFPTEVFEDRTVDVAPFTKLPKTAEAMEYVYSHTVRYTDLDRNRHMTNLRYVALLMDAFDSDFYHENLVTDFELHYIGQCYEGEEIKICKKSTPDGRLVSCVRPDGSVAAVALIGARKRN
ncbi:MAG: thioesterase [Butyrivibrio sp.]|nr:thioesterase [Butyrivibrio sp.]